MWQLKKKQLFLQYLHLFNIILNIMLPDFFYYIYYLNSLCTMI